VYIHTEEGLICTDLFNLLGFASHSFSLSCFGLKLLLRLLPAANPRFFSGLWGSKHRAYIFRRLRRVVNSLQPPLTFQPRLLCSFRLFRLASILLVRNLLRRPFPLFPLFSFPLRFDRLRRCLRS
jgi:hypothetical protein